MIDFKTFKKVITSIQKHRQWQDRCTKFIEKEICTDAWAFVTAGDDLSATTLKLLEEIFDDKGKWIDWWLYEDVEKVVGFSDGTQKNISKLKDLYAFLLENKAEHDKEKENKK